MLSLCYGRQFRNLGEVEVWLEAWYGSGNAHHEFMKWENIMLSDLYIMKQDLLENSEGELMMNGSQFGDCIESPRKVQRKDDLIRKGTNNKEDDKIEVNKYNSQLDNYFSMSTSHDVQSEMEDLKEWIKNKITRDLTKKKSKELGIKDHSEQPLQVYSVYHTGQKEQPQIITQEETDDKEASNDDSGVITLNWKMLERIQSIL